jgi:hypothetical protein
MDFKEAGWEGVNCIYLVQVGDKWRALVNTVMNFRIPRNAANFLTIWKTVSFLRSLSFSQLVSQLTSYRE